MHHVWLENIGRSEWQSFSLTQSHSFGCGGGTMTWGRIKRFDFCLTFNLVLLANGLFIIPQTSPTLALVGDEENRLQLSQFQGTCTCTPAVAHSRSARSGHRAPALTCLWSPLSHSLRTRGFKATQPHATHCDVPSKPVYLWASTCALPSLQGLSPMGASSDK